MPTPFDTNTRATATATIASAASTSGTIDLRNTALLGFIAPSAWTTAAFSLEGSVDGSTFAPIYDQYGTQVASWSALVASGAYTVDPATLLPFLYARIRSGTSASPVTQGASRAFTVITRQLA